MTKFYGWAGAILNVDLTRGKIEKEELDPAFASKYLGASGFNSARLFDLVKAEMDALSPENVLMVGVGPLSGTLAPGSARMTVAAKSPLTDIFGDSNAGGFFASELKYAGYDQIVVSGKSEHPVYLWIDDDRTELRDASHLWGKSTWDTAKLIKEELGDYEIEVMCIGQAGENLVRFANIIIPLTHAFGRTGMGAVMGSKNLKAIAVRGTKDIAIARPQEFLKACKETREYNITNRASNYTLFHNLGTPGLIEDVMLTEMAGVKNHSRSLFPNWEAISGRRFKKDFATPMRACSGCHVACHTFYNVRSGEFAGTYGGGPEFATLGGFGLRCYNDNLPSILKLHGLFNQYGMDVLSGAGAYARVMDCYEQGILSENDLDGIPMTWGNYNAMIEMTHKVAKREGFGNIIAEGEKRFPELVGKGSEQFTYHSKGLGLITIDPRANGFQGAAYCVATRGCDHLKTYYGWWKMRETDIGKKLNRDPEVRDASNPKGKGIQIKWAEDIAAVVNACGVCHRTVAIIQLIASMLSSATGVDFDTGELLQAGARIYNIQKAFNSRLGITRKDDNYSVPEKFTQEPLHEGKCKGSVLDLNVILDDYYKVRGWDQETGLQTRATLEELGLEQIADELEKVNAIK